MNKKEYLSYIIIILFIVLIPFLVVSSKEFAGVDAQIEGVLGNINPQYIPWFNPVLPELSGEMETFLFSVQAGFGAGVVGYVLGYLRGRRVGQNIKFTGR